MILRKKEIKKMKERKEKVLILEDINGKARELFEEKGYEVDEIKKSLDDIELMNIIGQYSVLCIRSKTKITKEIIEKASKLKVIGAFCIGTNQIDLSECGKRDIRVFNAPFSNTRSVAELAIGEMIVLMRNIIQKNKEMQSGVWKKSSNNSNEIRGKKLGIIGYGNIGSQLSVLAEHMGLIVSYYDIQEKMKYGNATPCSLDQLLKESDIISVHIDGRTENTNFISHREFELMKDGVIFINLSRGFVVNLDALVHHLHLGKLRGVSLDVFPDEPSSSSSSSSSFSHSFSDFPNVILTPHIAGSTSEAQSHIANFVPPLIINYLEHGSTTYSVTSSS